jgi:glycosyltransferase involved in cell wall biosynthesis
LNIAATDTVVVFCGKFQPKKNPALLVEAFKQVAKSNAHLILVGNGELEEQLKVSYEQASKARELKQEEKKVAVKAIDDYINSGVVKSETPINPVPVFQKAEK